MNETLLWWLPLIAASLHVCEEFVFPGGFADWDRVYRPDYRKSITPRFHVVINALLLLACLQVAWLGSSSETVARRYGAAAWLTFAALLFSNAIYHVLGSIRTRRYSPGMVSGLLLYVPMAFLGYGHFLSTHEASVGTAATAALLGGSYHLWSALLHRARSRSA